MAAWALATAGPGSLQTTDQDGFPGGVSAELSGSTVVSWSVAEESRNLPPPGGGAGSP